MSVVLRGTSFVRSNRFLSLYARGSKCDERESERRNAGSGLSRLSDRKEIVGFIQSSVSFFYDINITKLTYY